LEKTIDQIFRRALKGVRKRAHSEIIETGWERRVYEEVL